MRCEELGCPDDADVVLRPTREPSQWTRTRFPCCFKHALLKMSFSVSVDGAGFKAMPADEAAVYLVMQS